MSLSRTGAAVAMTCSVALALAADATAGIREATLEVSPATVVNRPSLRFSITDASTAPVRVARLNFRRVKGISVHLPEKALVGVVGFTDPSGRTHRVDLRKGRAQIGRSDRRLLADSEGLQVVLRETGLFFLVVRPPEGSTNVVVTLTAGNTPRSSLLRTTPCHPVRFVVRLSPVSAGLVDDRAATVTAAAQRAARICS